MNRYSFFVGLFAAAAVYGLLTLWTSRRAVVPPANQPVPPLAAAFPVKIESASEESARMQATKESPETRELAIKANTVAALEALKQVGGDARPDREAIVAAVVRAAPNNADALWVDADKREAAGTLTVGDLAGLASIAAQRFETALNQNAAALTAKEKQALRIWFQSAIIDANIDGLRKRLAPGGG